MTTLDEGRRERIREAIVALPEPTGTVYRQHLLDDLDYRSIEARLDLSVAEVEHHVAQAILFIDRYLRATGP